MSEKKNDIGRYSSKNKMKIVLEHIKGETLDALSRKHKIPAHLISAWHEKFLEGGQSGLKTQAPDRRDEEIRKLKEKLGHLMFEFDAVATVNQAMQSKLEKKLPFR
jgi:transposase-like protein